MDAVERLSEDLRSALKRHGLTADDIDSLLRDDTFQSTLSGRGYTADGLRECVQRVVSEEDRPADRRQFAALLQTLNDVADLDIQRVDSLRWYASPLKIIRTVFAVLIFFAVFYMLIGGLHTTYPSHWWTRLAEFAGLLLLLGVYEGLQICVATLRLKDLHGMRHEYPRAARLHRSYSSEESARNFYAGRQFFVVIIVFMSAYLTGVSAPDRFPFTDTEIPSWFAKSLGRVFWDLGMAGALVTLWFGQLVPQFVANRVPVRFSDFPGMGIALRLALALDLIGVTRPGTWLSQVFGRRPERIPSSTREAYRQYVEDLHGYGVVGMKKEWSVSRRGVGLSYAVTAVINRRGLESVTDDGLFINGRGFRPKFSGSILGRDGVERELAFESTYPEREGNITQFQQVVTPKHGSFQLGDILTIETDVECDAVDAVDYIVITQPTKYIVARVVFEDDPSETGKIVIKKSVLDPVRGEYAQVAEQEIMPRIRDGLRIAEFIDFYPDLNARYELQWSHRY